METNKTTAKKRNKIIGAVVVAGAVALGAVSVGTAVSASEKSADITDQTPAKASSKSAEARSDDGPDDDYCELLDIAEFSEELTEDELTQIRETVQADDAKLAEAFDNAGITYSWIADEELDIDIIDWDYEDEEANELALETLGEDLEDIADVFGDEIDLEDFEGWFDLSEEDIDEIRQDAQATNAKLVEAFDKAGVAYTTVADEELGIDVIEFDYDDLKAAELAEEVFGQEFAAFAEDLSEEGLEELRQEIKADDTKLAEAFDEAGIAYSWVTDDELDIDTIEWDYSNDEAEQIAAELFDEDIVIDAEKLLVENC